MSYRSHFTVISLPRTILVFVVIADVACAPVSRSPAAATDAPTAPSVHVRMPGAASGTTAFVDVAVVPMDTERVLAHQTVVVQNGWITALGPVSRVKVPAESERVDGRGKYLIPGLADMHAHLDNGATPPYDNAMAEHRLFLWLANGMTTVRNLDHTSYTPGESSLQGRAIGDTAVLRLRARGAAGEILSPRIYTSGHIVKPLLKDVPRAVAAYKAAGYDFIKVWKLMAGPGRLGLFDSLLTAATQARLPIVGHVDRVTTLERALTEYRSIEHLTGYIDLEGKKGEAVVRDARGDIQVDTARIRALAVATRRGGVWNCPTQYNSLLNNLVWNQGDPGGQLAIRRLLIKALQDAGAGLLLGSDRLQHMKPELSSQYQEPLRQAAARLPLYQEFFRARDTLVKRGSLEWKFEALYGDAGAIHRELLALVDAGLTPYQALVTGTRNVAAYFGTLDETGTVAVGKRADMVLLAGNPLEDVRYTSRLTGVMVNGRWLARDQIDSRVAAIKSWLGRRCPVHGSQPQSC